jgi:hypothetical protein
VFSDPNHGTPQEESKSPSSSPPSTSNNLNQTILLKLWSFNMLVNNLATKGVFLRKKQGLSNLLFKEIVIFKLIDIQF